MDRQCFAEDCSRPTIAKGLCTKHYQRMRNYGSIHPRPNPNSFRSEFIKAAVASDTDDCIIWPYSTSMGGYGVAEFKGRQTSAHRIALILAEGEPSNPLMEAAHDPKRCTNKACINPKHLRWATRVENEADKIVSGTKARGEKASTSEMTERDVLDVYSSNEPTKDAAARYGVCHETIRRIRNGKTWAWLTEAARI